MRHRPVLICSSGEGGLCLVDSKSGKVKLRIENVFATKSPIGAFISLDVEDRLLAAGNDDGDVIVRGCIVRPDPDTSRHSCRLWI